MILHPEVSARELDVATTVRRAQAAALVSGAGRTVPLAVVETPATVQGPMLKPLQDKLDRIMRDGVTLRYGSQSYHVKGERLALFIYVTPGEDGLPENYEVTVSDEDMQRLARAIAKELYEPAREVRYRLVDGKITLVQAPKEGMEVDVVPTAANLKAATLAGEAQADMAWHPIRPSTGEVDTATIKTPDLLAGGQTYYGASSAERNWNVTYGASKLDGWYIPPGEVFSVNEALGPLTLEAGFKMGWAILVEGGDATTIPSEAGGICQVSTTLFHGVFRAGLPVTEYHHHSYWIANYGRAPSGMQGLDSTISPPWSDLKFRNNTGNWVLIRSKGDTQNLTIQLYGTNPGWEVRIKNPVITDIVKTDPRLRRETSDKLPAGKVVRVETAQDGFTSTIERTVLKDGAVVDQWTIKNTYLPAHNVEVVGTGKDVPTPGPVPTATPKP
jgi:vancomycin resistance protein YoaR